jgi:hypothetical protein
MALSWQAGHRGCNCVRRRAAPAQRRLRDAFERGERATAGAAPADDAGRRATVGLVMTAKEKLRVVVEELSESEAEGALDYIVSRRHDQLDALLDSAPVDDEPSTPEEEAAVQLAREELQRGETVSLDEIRAELA